MENIKRGAAKGFSRGITRILHLGSDAILVIAPFYTPLTVWAASQMQHFDLLRIWKEVALASLGILAIVFIVLHWKRMGVIFRDRLILLIAGYSLLMVVVAIYDLFADRVSYKAVIYGLMINLRPVSILALLWILYRYGTDRPANWKKVVLIPAAVVIGFGVLQMTVLPDDVLRHIGYSKATTIPFQTVDNHPDFVRIQSFLRGPNPLGAYTIVVTCLALSLVISGRQKLRQVRWYLALAAGSLLVLYGTYSRSALVGTVIALGVLALATGVVRISKTLVIASVAAVVVLGSGVYIARDNNFIQNVVFHSSEESRSARSSNDERADALMRSVEDVAKHPLGQGVGSAGPASLRNQQAPAKIAENYFLQVGQEAGWLALVLLCAIHALVAYRLYLIRKNPLAAALLASLAGLVFVNLVSHAWADDTLAYVWWGLAGLALARHRVY